MLGKLPWYEEEDLEDSSPPDFFLLLFSVLPSSFFSGLPSFFGPFLPKRFLIPLNIPFILTAKGAPEKEVELLEEEIVLFQEPIPSTETQKKTRYTRGGSKKQTTELTLVVQPISLFSFPRFETLTQIVRSSISARSNSESTPS